CCLTKSRCVINRTIYTCLYYGNVNGECVSLPRCNIYLPAFPIQRIFYPFGFCPSPKSTLEIPGQKYNGNAMAICTFPLLISGACPFFIPPMARIQYLLSNVGHCRLCPSHGKPCIFLPDRAS